MFWWCIDNNFRHNCEYDVVVESALRVPSLTTNILSASQLISKRNRVQFTNSGCDIYNRSGESVGTVSLLNGVYKLRMPEALMVAVVDSSDIWYHRLSHVDSKYLNRMQNAGEEFTLDSMADGVVLKDTEYLENTKIKTQRSDNRKEFL